MAVSGCSKKTGSDTDLKTEDTSPITFDWYVNYSWFVTTWGGNAVSDYITDETGVSVNFISPPGNETEKLNALIASDSLPDILTIGWWEPQYGEMVDRGMVYALNELADKYDPFFYEVADKTVVNWYTWADGNIYCYPNSSYTPADLEKYDNIASNQTFLVRKDIYEALGRPDMTTPEGFYKAVKRATELFPDVDGNPLIPIGSHVFTENGCVSFDQYLQNFLAVPYEKNGEYYDRYTDEEYIRWLKLFRKLSEEGYLSPDIFVDTRTQMSEKIAEGRYFCMLYQRTDLADQEKLLYEKDPDSIYIAVDGPRNSKGADPVLPSNGIPGWTITLISKNCEHPDRAIKFLSYLMSEHGQKLIYLGVPGVTYTEENGEIKLIPEVEAVLNSDREEYNRKYGADDTYWMLQNNVMQLKWRLELKEPMKQLEEWTYPYTKYLGQYEVMVPKDPELAGIFTKCDRLWSEALKELLLSDSEEEFDRILEKYKEDRKAAGYDRVMAERTRQMKENKARLKED
ncbi:MAG: extracellular solute-binding protein [Lachnospiraceae bacterium]|nr:extracellular solute-binding protein [Lachnospiraceae bacterium]